MKEETDLTKKLYKKIFSLDNSHTNATETIYNVVEVPKIFLLCIN